MRKHRNSPLCLNCLVPMQYWENQYGYSGYTCKKCNHKEPFMTPMWKDKKRTRDGIYAFSDTKPYHTVRKR